MEKEPTTKNQTFKTWLETKATSGEEYFYNPKTKEEEKVPVVFVRFGHLPTGNSTNHFYKTKEKGVSAYAAYYDRITKKFILQSGGEQLLATQGEITDRPAYLVTGTPVKYASGGDGEQLLDRNTIKIIRKLKPEEITTEIVPDSDLSGNQLEKIPTITFPTKDYTKEIRRKTFKVFNNLNLPKNTNGTISYEHNSMYDVFRFHLEAISTEQEMEIYQISQKAQEELKNTFGNRVRVFLYSNPPQKEQVIFKIKNGKITL